MDVERIQKINNLALDLMKQGLASDKDDAIAQAERIFRAKPEDSFLEVQCKIIVYRLKLAVL